ncbi:hypothetical protein HPP92_022687 [Vanilla planifolia]|uniref:Uncharacterized protein n=1 Tax=Vanilla planifolia TaxID=51239 RepID=A0A835PTQ8_VANPL|nr:hypothetical protein HPP92_022687 [Vanilla planifolia]
MEKGETKSFDSSNIEVIGLQGSKSEPSIEGIQKTAGTRSFDLNLKVIDDDKVGTIEGKVNWKGRPAREGVHGGVMFAILPTATFGMENLASIALAVNLVTYLMNVMHYGLADASNAVTNFTGTGYMLSVLMAIFADTLILRYKVVCLAIVVEVVGFVLLAIQAKLPNWRPPACNPFDPTSTCIKVNGIHELLLFAALYLLALGSAGVKAAVPPQCAEQFEERDPREAQQISSFFNWLLLSLCLGGSISLTFVVWIEDVKGFAWGFGVSAAALLLALLVFASGIPRYRIPATQKSSAFLEIFQVLVVALRNRKLQLPKDPNELYEIAGNKNLSEGVEFLPHRDILRFLDKAAIKRTNRIAADEKRKWMVCRVTQVENAKIILSLIPIFCSTIIMSTCLAQLQTFSIRQGTTMDARIGSSFHIPPASLPIFPVLFMVVIIPLYDRVFVPFARRLTGIPTGITHLQRIGVGLVLACLSMATAALVEIKRKHVAEEHGMLDAIPVLQPLPISIFWLSLQYFIFGLADIFTFVGLLEFFYSQAPTVLKSFATSFLWCSLAFGYFLSTILVHVVNLASRGKTGTGGWLAGNNLNRIRLEYFYGLLAILCLLDFILYLLCANWYKYKSQPHQEEGKGRTTKNGTV